VVYLGRINCMTMHCIHRGVVLPLEIELRRTAIRPGVETASFSRTPAVLTGRTVAVP